MLFRSVTSKNFEKGATKPGKKGVKQFKNKPQGGKGPKDKFQKANKFSKKRKFQPDGESDGKLSQSRCRSLPDQGAQVSTLSETTCPCSKTGSSLK